MVYEIIVTELCNLNCKYCFEAYKGKNQIDEKMLPDIISFITNDMIKYSIEKASVSINGGEALLNYHVVKKLVKNLIQQGIENITVSTNLTLATPEILQFFHENNVILHVSIDGQKDTHDSNRVHFDGKGSFEYVIKNIRYIISTFPDWHLSYSLVFTPGTVGKLYDNVKYLYDIGIKYISASFCTDSDWSETHFEIFREQMEHLATLYINKIENDDKIYFSLFCNSINYTLKRNGFCGMAYSHRAILPNGDILPCGMFTGTSCAQNFIIGNIYDGVDQFKVDALVQKMTIDTGECTGCALINRCHKYCFATNMRVEGDLLKIPDSICMINQICLLQTDKIIDYFYHNNLDLFLKKFNINKAVA
jgi:uncharacterized protein